MNSRFLSAVNYMLDAFAISLALVFIDKETAIPLAIVWIILSALIAMVSFTVFLKRDYQPKLAIAIVLVVMALSIIAGASIFIFAAFSMMAMYRLHARFSMADDSSSRDGRFLMVFVLIFSAMMFFSLINPKADEDSLLYPIAIATIIFYVIARLLYRYIASRNDGALFSHVLLSIGGILGLSAAGGWLVYGLGENARQLAGSMLGGFVSIILWPFAGLLENITEYLSGLSTEEEMQENLDKMDSEDAAKETHEAVEFATAEFDYSVLVIIVLLVFLFLLILWLRKVKPEKESRKEESTAEIQRFETAAMEEQQHSSALSYSKVDLDIIREAFRDFETLAADKGKGRHSYETVREWLQRMDWPVAEPFFNTYDFVRYGNGQISEQEAFPFLEEINKINEKYLKENV